MDDLMKSALELVKAQAAVRVMSDSEILNMARAIMAGLSDVNNTSNVDTLQTKAVNTRESKKSIKEKSVTCLECGKVFKVITEKHLSTHGLDKKSYCEKWGLKKGTSLVAKELQRARRKKMTDMKLWERREALRQK